MTFLPGVNTIAIVGRANVGKSMLFNRLCGRAAAIVHARPGMTLDIITGKLPNSDIVLWDTAGIAGEDDDSGFAKMAQRQTENAINTAAAAMIVVDARDGLHPADAGLLRQLRRRAIPRFFVVNKSEGLPAPLGDFYALGESPMFAVSAKRGEGCAELAEALTKLPLPMPRQQQSPGNKDKAKAEDAAAIVGEEESPLSVAIVGRPNVGKSTLINRILGYERMLVSDVAGTTRDSVRCDYRAGENEGGGVFVLTDTAGLRRRRADNPREKLSVSAARQTLGRAEVGLLMTDITTGATHQDKRIAALMAKSACAAVILANKADKINRKERAARLAHIVKSLPLVSPADAFAISAQSKRDGDLPLAKILHAARAAAAGGKMQLSSAKLTRMLEKITAHLPPPRAGSSKPKLRYAHQGGRFCIVVHGSGADKIGDDYKRYLAAAFCRALSLRGAPMKIICKAGGGADNK